MEKQERIWVGLFAIFAFAAIFSPARIAAADSQALIVATNYPPYEIEHPDGGLRGFDVEVTEEAFRRAGIEATYEFYPWSRCMSMVKEGKATAVLSAVYKKERKKTMIFSDPISSMTDILLVHKDYEGPKLAKLKDLGKLKLLAGVAKGAFTEKSLIEYGVPYDVSPNDDIVLKKLLDKRIDVVPAVLESILYQMKNEGGADRFKWFLMEDVKTNEFHLAFSRKWPNVEKIAARFNHHLKEMKQDGAYDAIHRKYR